MEPNVNPLVPDNPGPSGSPNPTSPYSQNELGASQPQLANSAFQSRSITPLSPPASTAPVAPADPSPPSPTQPPVVPSPPPFVPAAPTVSPSTVVSPNNPQPVTAQPEPIAPAVIGGAFVGADVTAQPNDKVFTPSMPGSPKKRKFSFKSKPVIAGFVVLLIGVGFAAYYFGYKTNPSVIYSQSLKNTAKGYDKLIEYVNNESKANYKGTSGTGSFQIKSGDYSTDGKIAFKSDDKNGELSFDVGLEGTRVKFDGRLIDSQSGSQDIYVKASGLKGLGSLLGSSDLDAPLASIDDQWIVIDHTLLDSLAASNGTASAKEMLPPSSAQLMSAAEGFGKVNQEYLFSTDKDKAVMTVTQKHGMESVDGHNTYHYTVALQKENVKRYIDAQQAALKASKLNTWLKNNGYDEIFDSVFASLKESADTIKSNDTFDMWSDIDTRLIYKVRFADKSNAVNNYIDVGLDYTGGDDFPFFIAGQSKDEGSKTTAKAVMNLNTKTQSTDFSLDVKSTGYADVSFNMKVSIKPTNQAIKIEKPAGAKTLADVLSQLGYGDLLSELPVTTPSSAPKSSSSNSIQSKARNSERSSDIKSLQTNVEAFYTQNGYYPSRADLNNASWLKTNMKSFDTQALQDPSATSKLLVAAPAAGVYAYQVTDSSGRSCEADDTNCSKYTLTATFEGTVNGRTTAVANNLDGS